MKTSNVSKEQMKPTQQLINNLRCCILDLRRGQIKKCKFHWQGMKRAMVEMIVPEGYEDEEGFHYGKK